MESGKRERERKMRPTFIAVSGSSSKNFPDRDVVCVMRLACKNGRCMSLPVK